MENTKTVLSAKAMELVKGFDEALKADKFLVIQAIVAEVLEEAQSAEILDFLQVESDRIEKRNSKKSTKPSKTAVEKEKDIEALEAFFLELNEETQKIFLHGKEITDSIEAFKDYTPQKITSRLSVMVAQGILVKDKATNDKKKTGYKLA